MGARDAITPGPRNTICDVAGIAVGNATHEGWPTGVTAVIPDAPCVAAVDARGGGTGTRETAALDPSGTVTEVHGLVLSGGSAFGLDAASGVMAWLRERGRGFAAGHALVPIVPAAILFDLRGEFGWELYPPHRELGYAAAEAAGRDFALGSTGAGAGAKAGRIKGGLGSASYRFETAGGTATVGALVAANPMGDVLIPGSRAFWAWPFEAGGEFGGVAPPAEPLADLDHRPALAAPGTNTTIAVVATDIALTRAQALRVAIMAQDGLARAIRPAHGPLDGDTVFALSTGAVPLEDPLTDLGRLGMLAGDCLARAVARGVYEATAMPGFPAWRDL